MSMVEEQLSLTEEAAKLRHDAKETSRLAALKAKPNSGTHRRRILDLLAEYPHVGCTDDEISSVLHMSPNTARPRRVELVEGGWVEDSGTTRPSLYGNAAIVWRVTDKARTELAIWEK